MIMAILLTTTIHLSSLTVSTAAFKNGENIPSKYTCEGSNETPAFTVTGIPEGSKSIVFLMDDPDAPGGNFDHWVLFNIPVTGTEITIDHSTSGTHGANGKGENKYTGPCPPTGIHHYHFKVYSLDTTLNLKDGAKKKEVEEAMRDHILSKVEMTGLYEKGKK
jgi:Raf kinase inhibitor-like YbhB/YbcL family protein